MTNLDEAKRRAKAAYLDAVRARENASQIGLRVGPSTGYDIALGAIDRAVEIGAEAALKEHMKTCSDRVEW